MTRPHPHPRFSLPLYLASSSPRRRQLLAQAGITFEPLVVPVDEEALSESYTGPLGQLGEYLACEKATAARRALQAEGRDGLVLASDTTVLLDGRSLAKPRDEREAAVMLRALRGREHVVATGVALAGPADGALSCATTSTRVLMRDYGDDEIATYVATGDPLDKAGSYSIQHPAFSPVASIAGCHLGVIGLPICLVEALVTGAPLPPVCQHGADDHCSWSARCTPPYPQPDVVHCEPDRETAT
jgi:septum formation protein